MEFNKVTPEIIEQLKAIAPGRAFAGEEINEDYAHDEMRFYGQRLPQTNRPNSAPNSIRNPNT